MEFCPNCKKILKVSKKTSAPVLSCAKCGYQTNFQPAKLPSTKITSTNNCKNEVAIIDKKESKLTTSPIVQAICPACGQNKSETWGVAVGSEGRTSSLIFLKCTSCGYTTREAN